MSGTRNPTRVAWRPSLRQIALQFSQVPSLPSFPNRTMLPRQAVQTAHADCGSIRVTTSMWRCFTAFGPSGARTAAGVT
jgi:hypothetical protein